MNTVELDAEVRHRIQRLRETAAGGRRPLFAVHVPSVAQQTRALEVEVSCHCGQRAPLRGVRWWPDGQVFLGECRCGNTLSIPLDRVR